MIQSADTLFLRDAMFFHDAMHRHPILPVIPELLAPSMAFALRAACGVRVSHHQASFRSRPGPEPGIGLLQPTMKPIPGSARMKRRAAPE
jgi:hypothetical protein